MQKVSSQTQKSQSFFIPTFPTIEELLIKVYKHNECRSSYVEVFMAGRDPAEDYPNPAPLYKHRPVYGPSPTQARNVRPKPAQNGPAQPNPGFYELYGLSSHCLYFVFTFECIPLVFDLIGLILQVQAQPNSTCVAGICGGCRAQDAESKRKAYAD